MLKAMSLLGFLAMVAAILALLATGNLLALQPITIAVQAAAVALMIWARCTLGWRSFHASADPTAGGLVTTGPYAYVRHPIYTAVCLFAGAGVVTNWSGSGMMLGVLLVLGSVARMVCEERLMAQMYPEYIAYAATTKRMIPYVF